MLDATLNQALETERIAVQAALGIKLFQMENTLKAVADGIVGKINVRKGQAVEKNEVLIQLG